MWLLVLFLAVTPHKVITFVEPLTFTSQDACADAAERMDLRPPLEAVCVELTVARVR